MAYMERKERSANRAVTDFYRKSSYAKHRAAIQNVKSSLDFTKPPAPQPHLYKGGKKEGLMEERYAQIEKDNMLLLNKMQEIINHDSPLVPKPPAPSPSRSLNITARRGELMRITEENIVSGGGQWGARKGTACKLNHDAHLHHSFRLSNPTPLPTAGLAATIALSKACV